MNIPYILDYDPNTLLIPKPDNMNHALKTVKAFLAQQQLPTYGIYNSDVREACRVSRFVLRNFEKIQNLLTNEHLTCCEHIWQHLNQFPVEKWIIDGALLGKEGYPKALTRLTSLVVKSHFDEINSNIQNFTQSFNSKTEANFEEQLDKTCRLLAIAILHFPYLPEEMSTVIKTKIKIISTCLDTLSEDEKRKYKTKYDTLMKIFAQFQQHLEQPTYHTEAKKELEELNTLEEEEDRNLKNLKDLKKDCKIGLSQEIPADKDEFGQWIVVPNESNSPPTSPHIISKESRTPLPPVNNSSFQEPQDPFVTFTKALDETKMTLFFESLLSVSKTIFTNFAVAIHTEEPIRQGLKAFFHKKMKKHYPQVSPNTEKLIHLFVIFFIEKHIANLLPVTADAITNMLQIALKNRGFKDWLYCSFLPLYFQKNASFTTHTNQIIAKLLHGAAREASKPAEQNDCSKADQEQMKTVTQELMLKAGESSEELVNRKVERFRRANHSLYLLIENYGPQLIDSAIATLVKSLEKENVSRTFITLSQKILASYSSQILGDISPLLEPTLPVFLKESFPILAKELSHILTCALNDDTLKTAFEEWLIDAINPFFLCKSSQMPPMAKILILGGLSGFHYFFKDLIKSIKDKTPLFTPPNYHCLDPSNQGSDSLENEIIISMIKRRSKKQKSAVFTNFNLDKISEHLFNNIKYLLDVYLPEVSLNRKDHRELLVHTLAIFLHKAADWLFSPSTILLLFHKLSNLSPSIDPGSNESNVQKIVNLDEAFGKDLGILYKHLVTHATTLGSSHNMISDFLKKQALNITMHFVHDKLATSTQQALNRAFSESGRMFKFLFIVNQMLYTEDGNGTRIPSWNQDFCKTNDKINTIKKTIDQTLKEKNPLYEKINALIIDASYKETLKNENLFKKETLDLLKNSTTLKELCENLTTTLFITCQREKMLKLLFCYIIDNLIQRKIADFSISPISKKNFQFPAT
jgi:hypothetical protein